MFVVSPGEPIWTLVSPFEPLWVPKISISSFFLCNNELLQFLSEPRWAVLCSSESFWALMTDEPQKLYWAHFRGANNRSFFVSPFCEAHFCTDIKWATCDSTIISEPFWVPVIFWLNCIYCGTGIQRGMVTFFSFFNRPNSLELKVSSKVLDSLMRSSP